MKLEAVNSRMSMNPTIEGFPPKDVSFHIDITYLIAWDLMKSMDVFL